MNASGVLPQDLEDNTDLKVSPTRFAVPIFPWQRREDSYLKEPARRVSSNSNGNTKSLFQDSKDKKLSLHCISFALF
jgi:hypothetical protein